METTVGTEAETGPKSELETERQRERERETHQFQAYPAACWAGSPPQSLSVQLH